MFEIPPTPTWDGLHPLIIHFPIALLLIAPLLIIIGILWKSKSNCFYISALILMIIGTISAFIAVSTGEAAGMMVIIQRTPEFNEAIEKHESLAEMTRFIFTVLTIIYAIILFLPKLLKKEIKPLITIIVMIAFIIIYSIGILSISSTAHNGGRLVHEFGVKANMGKTIDN
jgi:uncharacterized membrane protein